MPSNVVLVIADILRCVYAFCTPQEVCDLYLVCRHWYEAEDRVICFLENTFYHVPTNRYSKGTFLKRKPRGTFSHTNVGILLQHEHLLRSTHTLILNREMEQDIPSFRRVFEMLQQLQVVAGGYDDDDDGEGLRSRSLTDEGLAHIASIVMPTLTSLDLSQCTSITDVGLQHLLGTTKLKRLDLRNCRGVSTVGLQNMIRCQCPCLESLDLSECTEAVVDKVLREIGSTTNSNNWKLLHLSHCSAITDQGLHTLTKLTSLTSLDLSECDMVTDEGVSVLVHFPNLVHLNLSGCFILTNEGLVNVLCTLVSLQSLNLSGCNQLSDDTLEALAPLTSLTNLNLSRLCEVTDEGFKHLTTLTSLTVLDVSNCYLISNEGLGHMAKLTSLTELDLTGCICVPVDRLFHLIEILPSLTTLSMYGNHGIDDLLLLKGVGCLASLKNLHVTSVYGVRESFPRDLLQQIFSGN